MKLEILSSPEQLGEAAAQYAAELINRSVRDQGKARIILSTGASQFEFFKHFVTMDIDWGKLEVFHLDEYIDMPESHPASFKRYLKERFLKHVDVGRMHFVNGEGDVRKNIDELTRELKKEPIDLAVIGIGENAHIAFNDPPADFNTKASFIQVKLDDKCRNQQFREGWFDTLEDVPKVAITMTVHQIMQSKAIVSCVPHAVKAEAVKLTLEEDVSNRIPASILKTHADWALFLDRDSASRLDRER